MRGFKTVKSFSFISTNFCRLIIHRDEILKIYFSITKRNFVPKFMCWFLGKLGQGVPMESIKIETLAILKILQYFPCFFLLSINRIHIFHDGFAV